MKNIEVLLKKKGLFFKNSIEEYTDHYTSMYENYLSAYTKEQADVYIQVAINRLDSKQINKDYLILFYKNKLLMTASSSILILCTFFFLFQNEPPSMNPVDMTAEKISSTFGMRTHPFTKKKKQHKGIDIKGEIGDAVYATSSGKIIEAGFNDKFGYHIEIQHDKIYSTRYHHLSKVNVTIGEKVTKGKVIGEIGSTGLSTGPHLHYEVLENGKAIDPKPFIQA